MFASCNFSSSSVDVKLLHGGSSHGDDRTHEHRPFVAGVGVTGGGGTLGLVYVCVFITAVPITKLAWGVCGYQL
jgi:hypothetical protein